MTINKTIITSIFILLTIALNAQEIIQAGKYDDLMSAPEIAIAGGGTLTDWANISFYQSSNEELKNIDDPRRVVFMGNSITQQWSNFDPSFFHENPFINRGIEGLYSLVGVSFCMSLMFPTIYGIALENLTEEQSKIGSAGLVMAIVGSALLPKLQGLIIDIGGSGVKDVLILGVPEVNISFVLPLACFFYIACFGFGVFKNKFI